MAKVLKDKRIWVLVALTVFFVVINIIIVRYNDTNWVYTSVNEHMEVVDCAPYFDKDPGASYVISFDLAAEVPGTMTVYMHSSDGEKYSIGYYSFDAGTDFERHEIIVRPELINAEGKTAMLAFYGGYGTGVKPMVRHVVISRDETD